MCLKTSAASATAGALLFLALLGLHGRASLHSCSSRAGRDHKARAGHLWHCMPLLRRRVAFRVCSDHIARWQCLTRSKPLALGMVQTTHCRHGRHVGRHGVPTISCVRWPCHVSSIHCHWLRHHVRSTRHGPSLDRSGGHLVFHACYQVLLRNATRRLFVLSDFRLTQLMQHAILPFHLASRPDSLSESVACQHLFNQIIRKIQTTSKDRRRQANVFITTCLRLSLTHCERVKEKIYTESMPIWVLPPHGLWTFFHHAQTHSLYVPPYGPTQPRVVGLDVTTYKTACELYMPLCRLFHGYHNHRKNIAKRKALTKNSSRFSHFFRRAINLQVVQITWILQTRLQVINQIFTGSHRKVTKERMCLKTSAASATAGALLFLALLYLFDSGWARSTRHLLIA